MFPCNIYTQLNNKGVRALILGANFCFCFVTLRPKSPPLEPKTENYFSQISFDLFISRTAEV